MEVINESARGGDEDVGCCPKSCFLRLHIQATCREKSPPGGQFSQSPGLTEPCHLPGLMPDAEGTAENKTDEGFACGFYNLFGKTDYLITTVLSTKIKKIMTKMHFRIGQFKHQRTERSSCKTDVFLHHF